MWKATRQPDRVKSCNSKHLLLYTSSYWFTHCVNIERFVECDFLICKALLWLADWVPGHAQLGPRVLGIVLAFSLWVTTIPRLCRRVSGVVLDMKVCIVWGMQISINIQPRLASTLAVILAILWILIKIYLAARPGYFLRVVLWYCVACLQQENIMFILCQGSH